MPLTAPDLPSLLKLLGDPTRLRSLALLQEEELSVGELGRALGMAQSRVSNHLRVLREADVLAERHVGTSTFLRAHLGPEGSYLQRLWATLGEGLSSLPEHSADRSRLQQVLAARRTDDTDFFDRMAGSWDERGARFLNGQARQRAAVNLLPAGLVLADLGCGTGYLARSVLGLAHKLICIDRSEGMLVEARRQLLPLAGPTELDFRPGEFDRLPLAEGEVDGALLGMVLHHLPELDVPLREVRRSVRPGGSAVVLELAPHRESWMHQDLGDRHLGLAAQDVLSAMRRAGFVELQLEALEDRYCPTRVDPDAPGPSVALPLYIVRGRVPRT